MALASRNFKAKKALEHEIKDIYAKISVDAPDAAEATWDTTTPIVLTHATPGDEQNGKTVTLQVAPAAANPTDTILIGVTGTAAAIVITVTPNDGTNNTATPVPLTTAELAEYLDTGAVVGKTITLTDTGSLLANIAAASGGDATDLADGGEGDGEVATFSGGADNVSISVGHGIASFTRNGVGDYSLVLQDAYYAMKNFKVIFSSSTATDVHFQNYSEAVATSSSKEIRFLALAGATPVDFSAAGSLYIKVELKNSSTV